jgi:hypothetical protein
MYCTDAHAVGQCPASVRVKPHLNLRESRLEEADLGNKGRWRVPSSVLTGMGCVFVGECGGGGKADSIHCRESGLAGNLTLV